MAGRKLNPSYFLSLKDTIIYWFIFLDTYLFPLIISRRNIPKCLSDKQTLECYMLCSIKLSIFSKTTSHLTKFRNSVHQDVCETSFWTRNGKKASVKINKSQNDLLICTHRKKRLWYLTRINGKHLLTSNILSVWSCPFW